MPRDARADVLAEWSRWHDGYDTDRSRLTRGWVLAMHAFARPLAAAGVPPAAISATGVAAAAAATRTGRRTAVAAVLANAVCDGLDGAVARQRRTASRAGTTIDHVCDRATDVLLATALRRRGARHWPAVAAAVGPLLLERVRESLRAGASGAPPLATVGERPARVAVVVAGLLVAPTTAAVTVAALSGAGCAQLLAAWRRRAQ